MALKAVLENLDGVDDSIKDLYVKMEDGKFRIDVEGGFKIPSEIERLTSALGKERQRADELAKSMKAFDGLDAKAARDALAKVATYTEDQSKAAERAEQELQARLQPLTKERDELRVKAEELEGKFRDFSISNAVNGSKFLAEKVSKDPVHQAYVREHFKGNFTMEDGHIVAYDANGQRIYDGNGNPADVDTALEKLVTAHPAGLSLLAGSNAAGSGAKPSAGVPAQKSGTMRRSDFNKLSAAEQMKAATSGMAFSDD
ncbi:MAG: hypothetical protein PHN64_03830 [Desulfovibrionaceae bacterium]|nr:hypothetical protein [Desulfovibrionaceae bacterium]